MNESCIFLGSIYPQSVLDTILEEGTHADFAANTFQSGIVEGLQKYYEDVYIITSPVTSTFPKSKQKKYSELSGEFGIGRKLPFFFPGFLNFPFIKLMSEYYRIKKALNKRIKGNETVYIYALHTPFLLAAYSLRKKISKVCVIIPDLPDYMSHNRGGLRRFMKGINKRIINKCLKSFQFHVLFSKYMEPELPIKDKEWITVEGMFAASDVPPQRKETNKTILYTGIISSAYGVFDLLEAFHHIEGDDYRLWLCGSCPNEMPKLREYIESDKRIMYKGMMQKDEVRALQARATLLVNPRHSNKEFTKFSFPSKTMEYLASGTPTLMCRLPAIPQEYDEHLFYFDDESIDGFSKRIVEVCSMDKEYLSLHGSKSRNFILSEKNCYAQAKRIYDMVEK